MEKSNKRGKIPQSDWPSIMTRYEAGETLASIARTYDCSPPAISYIVSRSRAKQPNAEAAPPPSEPQLIKAPNGTAGNNFAALEQPPAEHRPEEPRPVEPRVNGHGNGHDRESAPSPAVAREPNGGFPGLPPRADSRPAQPQPPARPAEDRRTLHLSLGNGHANGNGHATAPMPHGTSAEPPRPQPAPPQAPLFQEREQDRFPRPVPPPQRPPEPRLGYDYGYHPAAAENGRSGSHGENGRKDTAGSFIDQELRTRVDGDITIFLAAFDAALAQDSQESRSALREATDRLLRAGARTRIELERLEARIPLPPRDTSHRSEPAWRGR